MKRNPRFIYTFLILFMAITGCAPAAPSSDSTALPCTTLTMFSNVTFWNLPEWTLAEGTVTAEVTAHTGIVLDTTIPPQAADRKLSLLLLKDELPDLLVLSESNVIRQLIDADAVWKLDELLETYCPDSHLLTRFPEDMRTEQIRRYGGWYAYPSNINSDDARELWPERTGYYGSLVRYRQNHGILWNRTLLKQAGLTENDLKTQSQVLAALEKIKSLHTTADGEEIIPLLFEGNSYQDSSLNYLNNSFGVEAVDENGNYKSRWLQPECKDTLKFVNTAVRSQYLFPEHLSFDNLQIRSLMKSDRVFCFIGNVANTGVTAENWLTTGPVLSESGRRPVLGMDLTTPAGWLRTFVSKSCKNPEAAARFIDYMTSDEGLMTIYFGEEGNDFYYDSDGLIRRTESGQQKAEDPASHLSKFWNFYNSAWEHSRIPVPEEESPEKQWADIECAFAKDPDTVIYNSSLLRLPDHYFPPESELRKALDAIEEFRRQQLPKVISASSDTEFESEYQLFLDGQRTLGIDKIDQKINEQMHRNFAEYDEVITRVNGL